MRIPTKASSNGFLSFIAGIIIWMIALIPTWIFICIRWLINPEGFWQELALIVAAFIVMGWLQGILLIFCIYATIFLISEGI